jgi:hypothetical protein
MYAIFPAQLVFLLVPAQISLPHDRRRYCESLSPEMDYRGCAKSRKGLNRLNDVTRSSQVEVATLVCIALSGSSLPTKVAQLGAIGCDHAQVSRNTSNTPVVQRFQWLISFYYVHAIGLQANYIDLAKDWTAFFKYEHEYSAGAHHRALPCLGQLLRSAFQNPPPLPKRGNSFRFPANLYSNSA